MAGGHVAAFCNTGTWHGFFQSAQMGQFGRGSVRQSQQTGRRQCKGPSPRPGAMPAIAAVVRGVWPPARRGPVRA